MCNLVLCFQMLSLCYDVGVIDKLTGEIPLCQHQSENSRLGVS